jgi:CelD/BcsL family acetyltransferase involved in cellulose biosynthesis
MDELERGLALEASGWKGAEGTAITSAAPTHAFYSAVAAAYHERGELRLGWLHIDGRPAAFSLCLLRPGRLYQLKDGMDDGLKRLSLGMVLRLKTVERCLEQSYEIYDLLGR